MNKCYTYYEEIKQINNCKNRNSTQQSLIELCKKSWEINGWELIVLNQSTAEKNSFFLEYSEIIEKLPTVNPPRYEYSCFMRWLAMAEIGGGLMIDYDVMNLGAKILEDPKNNKITVYQDHVPCVVYGTDEQYLNLCHKFCELKEECLSEHDNRPHISDMIMLSSKKIDFNKLHTVVDYPNKGLLVHCSQAHCHKNGKTKFDAMKEMMEFC